MEVPTRPTRITWFTRTHGPVRAECVAVRVAILSAVLASCLPPATATAAERPIALREGPGRELVQGICSSCHSLDYVLMNSPFLTLDQWRASVAKMRSTFGAPIAADDAETIARYLAYAYGRAGD